MRGILPAATVLLLVLAGCSQDPKTQSADVEADFDALGLQATETTGVLRGIIVDEAVRPVADATILVTGVESTRTGASGADGAFGFDGLPPGTYFLAVSKPGHVPTQTSADVEAGVTEPQIVKILLALDPASAPHIEEHDFKGFIECSVRPMIIATDCGGFVPGDPPGGQGIAANYEFAQVPKWIQSEMVWTSTQAAGDELSLAIQCLDGDNACPNGQWNTNSSEGRSPLMVAFDETAALQWHYGTPEAPDPYHIRVFTFGRSDLDAYDEKTVNDTLNSTTGGAVDCVHWPILFDPATCVRATGPGFVLNQDFRIFTHVFYGFAPEPGWRFSVDGAHPVPAS